jgi:hypothetical protein
MDRRLVVDLRGPLGIEVTQRIVAKGREMRDTVKALQIALSDVADVPAQRGNLLAVLAQRAILEEEGVQAHYLMSGGSQDRNHDRSDVTVVPRDQNTHL